MVFVRGLPINGNSLIGGAGDDNISQASVLPNGASGTVIDGGDGNDTISFNSSQVYTLDFVTISGGNGDDLMRVGVWSQQSTGAAKIDGGSGNDIIEVGHVEGSTNGEGYINGGDGNDIIRVKDTWGSMCGMWIYGSLQFSIFGGNGDDRFEIAGTQINVDYGAGGLLDGGNGFDTLQWSGYYNLTNGGHQVSGLSNYSSYKQELQVHNIEHIEIDPTSVHGETFNFTASDVASITQGSDFNQALLGLNLTGIGNTLFLDLGDNALNFNGWDNVGLTIVHNSQYDVYEHDGVFVALRTNLNLYGSYSNDLLVGYGGNDYLQGNGGVDTLIGGAGDDNISQASLLPNGASGTVIDGGDGNDTISFNSSQVYTLDFVTISGGNGDDLMRVSVWSQQSTGAAKIDGGSGNDIIEVGHVEGSTNGEGYINGGDGNDIIRVKDTWGSGCGMWIYGSLQFSIFGGNGDDRFEIAGTQINVGYGAGGLLDGGNGFDTLQWSGYYNLTNGGHQVSGLSNYSSYKQELQVHNIEHIEIDPTSVHGETFNFTASDVASITQGSDFNQALLGLNLTGIGNTLFLDLGDNALNLNGWDNVGYSTMQNSNYAIYQSGNNFLAIA